MADSDRETSSSDFTDEEGWEDANQEDDVEEGMEIISLLDDSVFADAATMVAHCKEKHGFDFLAVRDRLQLDFHGSVKLINYVRHKAHEGVVPSSDISLQDIEDDRYLRPVLENDAFIMCLDDLPGPVSGAGAGSGAGASGSASVEDLLQQNARLQAELEQLTTRFSSYHLTVQQTLDQRWGTDEPDSGPAKTAAGSTAKPKDESESYFEGYSHNDIHETMLKDTIRTDAYRDFIYNNKDLFAGKVVLDIGCGTGILSMFCAKAGAKQVIAVDNAAILDKAHENVFNNGLSSKIVCLKGKIEEVVLPVDKVDIIVSEWMGYCLLYEAMLPSVIYARDKYLKPDGLLVPSHASMWIAPVADAEYVADHISFWRDVYGFNMTAMQEGIHKDARVETMPQKAVCGSPRTFGLLNLHTTKVEDLSFRTAWTSKLSDKIDTLDGFLLWFDIFFATTREDKTITDEITAQEWVAAGGQERVSFTTGPYGRETHWRQGLLLTQKSSSDLDLSAGKELCGEISYAIPDNHARGLNIEVSWANTGGKDKHKQTWVLH